MSSVRADRKGSGPAKRRRWVAWASRLTLGVAGVVLLWVGENALHREAPPAPPFREADLPALPPAADNGWVAFQAKEPPTPDLQSNLAALCAPPDHGGVPHTWADVTAKQGPIGAFLASADAHRAVMALEEAMTKPVFADACPLGFGPPCNWFRLYRAHQAEELAILQRALEARHAEALRAAARLVRADASLLASFRSVLAQATTLAGAERTLVMLDLALDGYAAAGEAREPIDPAILRELGDALDGIRAEAIDLRRSVTAEYVHDERAMDIVTEADGSRTDAILARLFFDRGQTMRLVGERLEPVAAFAADPTAPPPPFPRPMATGALWWLHNPIGKRILDGTAMATDSLLAKSHRQRASILRRRDALRKRLTAMLAPRP